MFTKLGLHARKHHRFKVKPLNALAYNHGCYIGMMLMVNDASYVAWMPYTNKLYLNLPRMRRCKHLKNGTA